MTTDVPNPLLDCWQEVVGRPAAEALARKVTAGKEAPPWGYDTFSLLMGMGEDLSIEERPWVLASEARTDCCSRYSWAIPDADAIRVLANRSPLIEVGAGTGYWAALLTAQGADVIATDLHPPVLPPGQAAQERPFGGFFSDPPPTGNHWHRHGMLYHPVEQADAAVTAVYPDRTLLLVWPPYDEPMAYRAAVAHIAAGGRRLAYVGEGDGGATADDAFHELLDDAYVEIDQVALPQWPGMHDTLWVYEAKS